MPDYFKNPPPRRQGVLALLERPSGEFVIIRRSYWTTISRWGLPGGSLNPDERPWTGLARLMDERLGARVTPAQWLGVDHAPEKPGRHLEGVNWLYHSLVSDDVAEALGPAEDGPYDEVRWVTVETVADLVVDHELLRIEQCLLARDSARPVELLLGVPQHASRPRPYRAD